MLAHPITIPATSPSYKDWNTNFAYIATDQDTVENAPYAQQCLLADDPLPPQYENYDDARALMLSHMEDGVLLIDGTKKEGCDALLTDGYFPGNEKSRNAFVTEYVRRTQRLSNQQLNLYKDHATDDTYLLVQNDEFTYDVFDEELMPGRIQAAYRWDSVLGRLVLASFGISNSILRKYYFNPHPHDINEGDMGFLDELLAFFEESKAKSAVSVKWQRKFNTSEGAPLVAGLQKLYESHQYLFTNEVTLKLIANILRYYNCNNDGNVSLLKAVLAFDEACPEAKNCSGVLLPHAARFDIAQEMLVDKIGELSTSDSRKQSLLALQEVILHVGSNTRMKRDAALLTQVCSQTVRIIDEPVNQKYQDAYIALAEQAKHCYNGRRLASAMLIVAGAALYVSACLATAGLITLPLLTSYFIARCAVVLVGVTSIYKGHSFFKEASAQHREMGDVSSAMAALAPRMGGS